MEKRNLKSEISCDVNSCLMELQMNHCSSLCQINKGYCFNEKIALIKKFDLEMHVKLNYPGENLEEKYKQYYYDYFERIESYGSNFNDDDSELFDTTTFSINKLINRLYSPDDKDYFTIYEHVDLGNWYFYSKYLNDLFRISSSESRLNWLASEPGWYNHYFGQFCQNYISDFENSCNPESLSGEIFAPLIDDTLENLRVDENGIEYYYASLDDFEEELLIKEKNIGENEYEKSNCPIELTELYYDRILDKLDNDIWLLKSWVGNFNETTIISFKKWFIKKFNGEEEESNYNYYNWSIEFTQNLMRTSLDFVEENYSIHKSGGGSEYFFNKMEFLYCVAKASFEAKLFELIEDDGGIFEDED
jgi:hypothetical protein